MKKTRQFLVALAIGGLSTMSLLAQGFSSGSDGSYGALNITSNTTIAVPANGIFNCTTITVAQNTILTFTKNALNTPVYLLATSNVTISGTIDVSGQTGNSVVGGGSGPGGFPGGNPGSVSEPPGPGYGPGAGSGGNYDYTAAGAGGGSYALVSSAGNSTNRGSVYGSALLVPIVGGSGGGGAAGAPGGGGGGGGGGILIASTTQIAVTGNINANGGGVAAGVANGGSGGAIRLVAPVIGGSGTLNVNGGYGGGGGRIRIDALNRSQVALNFNPSGITSIGSLMLVFPTPTPRLDIINAAGTTIALGSGPVFVQLPFGASTNQTVTVRAQDFNSVVPVNLVLTPDNGVSAIYPVTIDNLAANPAQTVVNVVLPVNVQTSVNVWTQ